MFYKSGHGIIRMFFLHVQAAVCDLDFFFSFLTLDNVSSTTFSLSSSPGSLWPTYGSPSASSLTSCRAVTSTFSVPLLLCVVSLSFHHHLYTNLLPKTHWVNLAFRFIYLFFLALQFIMGLGNRPKGERIPYMVTLW